MCVKSKFGQQLPARRCGQSLWEALGLEEALGGCERLIKVGHVTSKEVSCAWGRMQELKDCNYGIMGELDWIRAKAPG